MAVPLETERALAEWRRSEWMLTVMLQPQETGQRGYDWPCPVILVYRAAETCAPQFRPRFLPGPGPLSRLLYHLSVHSFLLLIFGVLD